MPIMLSLASLPQPPNLTEQEQALQEEEMRACDMRAIQNVLYRYKEDPLVPIDEPLNLVKWWEVSASDKFASFIQLTL